MPLLSKVFQINPENLIEINNWLVDCKIIKNFQMNADEKKRLYFFIEKYTRDEII